MQHETLKKLVTGALLVAIILVLSGFYIPVGASKCFPVQSLINVIAGVLLGPWWAVAVAFAASLLRNIMGTGTLMAFPGSMVGAYLAGLLYRAVKGSGMTKTIAACAGEIIGTGILGAMIACPIAIFIMGKEAAIFTYVIPFIVSAIGGAVIAAVMVIILEKTKALGYMRNLIAQ